jgi:flagellar basal-body rod protein FlgC
MSVDPIAITRSALDVEWQRLQVIAQNLANENTVAGVIGGAYRPRQLVSGPATPPGAFAALVTQGARVPEPGGVAVLRVETAAGGARRIYDPGHPGADAAGFVSYPAIDHAREMALLVQTARAYESNLAVLALTRQMYMRALDMGRSG